MDRSTSKANSLPSSVNMAYLLALAMRYMRDPMLVAYEPLVTNLSVRALPEVDAP